MRFRLQAALVLAVFGLAGCITHGERLGAGAPAAGMGGAVLIGSIVQSDALSRDGAVLLRKVDASGRRFLPPASDTMVRFKLTPAFRFADMLRNADLTGRSRATPQDLTAFTLSPGLWAVEQARTYATNGYTSQSSNSIVGTRGGSLRTLAFEVRAGEVAAPPMLEVQPQDSSYGAGPADVSPRDDTGAAVVELAAQRGLTVAPSIWRPVTVECVLIENKPGRWKSTVACLPG